MLYYHQERSCCVGTSMQESFSSKYFPKRSSNAGTPLGGLQPCFQNLTYPSQNDLFPCLVHIWSRYPPELGTDERCVVHRVNTSFSSVASSVEPTRPPKRESLFNSRRRAIQLRRPERARNEGSTGPIGHQGIFGPSDLLSATLSVGDKTQGW
jgi:hypothetical protein